MMKRNYYDYPKKIRIFEWIFRNQQYWRYGAYSANAAGAAMILSEIQTQNTI